MESNPLKVEVEFRPQYVGDPCAVILLRLGQPFSVFEQDRGAERRSVFTVINGDNHRYNNFKPMYLSLRHMRLSEPLTGSWRADTGVLVLDGFEMDIEHGLLNAASVNISGEADHLLGPDERVCQVVRRGAKTCVAEYSEFIQPGVIDEASIAQPVDRKLGMVGIRDDCRNDTDLTG
jgi:hypothetical protein